MKALSSHQNVDVVPGKIIYWKKKKSHLFKSSNKVFCIIDFLGWTSQGFTLLLYFRPKTYDLKKQFRNISQFKHFKPRLGAQNIVWDLGVFLIPYFQVRSIWPVESIHIYPHLRNLRKWKMGPKCFYQGSIQLHLVHCPITISSSSASIRCPCFWKFMLS